MNATSASPAEGTAPRRILVWDAPVRVFNVVMGRWKVKQRDGAAVYYDARHPYNVDEMLDALGALPYKQRAAVTLRYWADWTDEQIADALECAPASVRVLLHRGDAFYRAARDDSLLKVKTHEDAEARGRGRIGLKQGEHAR